jgi:hypothetical protein
MNLTLKAYSQSKENDGRSMSMKTPAVQRFGFTHALAVIRAIALTIALCALMGRPVAAQNYYFNYYLNGFYIDTALTATPGYQGCSTQVYAFSDLNGVYQSGSAFYPNVQSINQSVLTSNGNIYSWSFGVTVYYADPYTNQCTSTNVSWGYDLSLKFTSSSWTGRLDSQQRCITNVYCTNIYTSQKACPGAESGDSNVINVVNVPGPPGVCRKQYMNFYLAERPWGTTDWWCSPGAAGDPNQFPFDAGGLYYGFCSPR